MADTAQSTQCMVHIPRTRLSDSLSGKLNSGRDRRMGRHARQPAQLIGAEAEHVVEAGIGAIELECTIQFALATQYAGRELVGETAVAFGETGEVPIAGIRQGCPRSHGAENLESRTACGSA